MRCTNQRIYMCSHYTSNLLNNSIYKRPKWFNFCECHISIIIFIPEKAFQKAYSLTWRLVTAARFLLHPQQCRWAPCFHFSLALSALAGQRRRMLAAHRWVVGSSYTGWMNKCLPSQIAMSPFIPAPFILAELSRCLCLHFILSTLVYLLCKYTPLKAASHR